MILDRKVYQELKQWKDSGSKKPLLLEGARRVGKTTILKEFGRKEYDNSYLLIDITNDLEYIRDYFQYIPRDMDRFFELIFSEYNVELQPGKSLIVFDEIQAFPKARQCLKSLVEDGRYDYIESGSLISIVKEVNDIVVPDERRIQMYPLDFEEFCWALGEKDLSDDIRNHFEVSRPLDDDSHEKAMKLFRNYLFVGGMPQPVVAYVEDKDNLKEVDSQKRDILETYETDMGKASPYIAQKVLGVFDNIPGNLSKHERWINFDDTRNDRSQYDYDETYLWLNQSMICNVCFNCTDPKVGLGFNKDNTYIKCYMGDTGLLVSQIFSDNKNPDDNLFNQILKSQLQTNEGMLYENAVAQMLVSSGHELYFHVHFDENTHKKDMEIDFLITRVTNGKSKISPIEVKSVASGYTTVSLNRFREKYRKDRKIGTAIVILPQNLYDDKVERVLYIPPYMTFCL